MATASSVPIAYNQSMNSTNVPEWLNKGDNAWLMISATLVGMQGVPGLVILYAGLVKRKWALNSAFTALYSFAAVMPVWILWGYKMSFGHQLLPFWGRAGPALSQDFLIQQTVLPSTDYKDIATDLAPFYPSATMVFYQFAFAAVTVTLLAGALLGRMNIRAWMIFVPIWVTFSYTIVAYSIWGGGFLFQWGLMDYAGGYVVHLSSGVAGFTAAYWVGPRLKEDKEDSQPNNLLLSLVGVGFLWMGWTGFNGGDPLAANVVSSVAVLNTHICATTSLLMWTILDVIIFRKPSIFGVIQGIITGLVCITPAAGLVQGWAAMLMGMVSGSVPWYTMTILSKKLPLLQKVDDTLGVLHTHAIAGILGGALTGLFAHPTLCGMFLTVPNSNGAFYGSNGGIQFLKQLVGAAFVICWNVAMTSIILIVIRLFVPLRMSDEELKVGDQAVHGEDAYAFGDQGRSIYRPGTGNQVQDTEV